MYVFFEPHWKLHPGKIPEKPEHDILKLNTWVAQRNYDLAIAAIKQNALTVLNPEIGIVESSCGTKCMIDGYVGWDRVLLHSPIQADKFYKWIGGYETKEIEIDCSPSDQVFYKTVAILTLLEEKKNTMENKELEPREVLFKYPQLKHLEIKVGSLEMAAIECAMREYAIEFEKFSLYKNHPTTASGSVAAPKEEFDKHKFFDQVSAINAKKDLVIESLQSENTALREALKELLPIAQWGYDLLVPFDKKGMGREWPAIIERARKLISK